VELVGPDSALQGVASQHCRSFCRLRSRRDGPDKRAPVRGSEVEAKNFPCHGDGRNDRLGVIAEKIARDIERDGRRKPAGAGAGGVN
jgi:hypothetical protein